MFVRTQLVLVGMFATTLGACANDNAADTITLRSSTTTTVASSEGDAATSTSAETSTTTTSTTGLAGSADLERMSLQLADMPTGWSESASVDNEDDDSGFCVEDAGQLVDTENWPRLEKEFSAGASGPFLTHSLLAAPEEESAQELMAQFAQLVDQCQSWEEADGTYTLTPVNYPEAGDQTFAVRLTVESDGFTFVGDIIVVREGNVLSLLIPIGLATPVEAETVVTWMEIIEQRD